MSDTNAKAKTLTHKEKAFVDEYMFDLNAKAAALRAGYNMEQSPTELMARPHVNEAIEIKLAERSKRLGVSSDRIIAELAKIAFANIGDIVDPTNAAVKHDVHEYDSSAISSIKVKTGEWGTEREVKLYDKKSALELLGKHVGLFSDRLTLDGSMALNITIDYGDEELEQEQQLC